MTHTIRVEWVGDGNSIRISDAGGREATVPCETPILSTTFHDDLNWYLENFVTSAPFDASLAQATRLRIIEYACALGRSLLRSNLLPKRAPTITGSLSIEILPGRSQGCPEPTIYWEVLANRNLWINRLQCPYRKVLVSRCSREITCSPEVQTALSAPRSKLAMLVVSAGPKVKEDVRYRLISKSLFRTVSQVRTKMRNKDSLHVDFLRPATWDSLVKHLERQAVAGRVYDIVHFDTHGDANNDLASLTLLGSYSPRSETYKPQKVSAADLGELLVRHKVSVAILNACDSAKRTGTGSSLAEVFISKGLSSVVAMAFKATDSSMELFMSQLYQSMLLDGKSLSYAVQAARDALYDNQSRKSRYGEGIELLDYFVPVLHRRPGRDFQTKLDDWLYSTVGRFFRRGVVEPNPEFHITGRDAEIMMVEHAFSESNTLLLHGPPGSGKTALARHLSWWWQLTKFADNVFVVDLDVEDGIASFAMFGSRIRTAIQAAHPALNGSIDIQNYFRYHNCLLIVDHLDAIETPIISEKSPLGVGMDLENLRHFFEGFQLGNSKLLLISRYSQSVVIHEELEASHAMKMGGFALDEAHEFMGHELGLLWWKFVEDYDGRVLLEKSLDLVDFLPEALKAIASHLRSDKEVPAMDQPMVDSEVPPCSLTVFYGLLNPYTVPQLYRTGTDKNTTRCRKSAIRLLDQAHMLASCPSESGLLTTSKYSNIPLGSPLVLGPFLGEYAPEGALATAYYRSLVSGQGFVPIDKLASGINNGGPETAQLKNQEFCELGIASSSDPWVDKVKALTDLLVAAGFSVRRDSGDGYFVSIHPILTIQIRSRLLSMNTASGKDHPLFAMGVAFAGASAAALANRAISKPSPHDDANTLEIALVDWNALSAFMASAQFDITVVVVPNGRATLMPASFQQLRALLPMLVANRSVASILCDLLENAMLPSMLQFVDSGTDACVVDEVMAIALWVVSLLSRTHEPKADVIAKALATAGRIMASIEFSPYTEQAFREVRHLEGELIMRQFEFERGEAHYRRSLTEKPRFDTPQHRRTVLADLMNWVTCRSVLPSFTGVVQTGETFAQSYEKSLAILQAARAGIYDPDLAEAIALEFEAPLVQGQIGRLLLGLDSEMATFAPIVNETLGQSVMDLWSDIIEPCDWEEWITRVHLHSGDDIIRNLRHVALNMEAAVKGMANVSRLSWYAEYEQTLGESQPGFSIDLLLRLINTALLKEEFTTVLRLCAEFRRVSPPNMSKLSDINLLSVEAIAYAELEDFDTANARALCTLRLIEREVSEGRLRSPALIQALCRLVGVQHQFRAHVAQELREIYPERFHILYLTDQVLSMGTDPALANIMGREDRAKLFYVLMAVIEAKEPIPSGLEEGVDERSCRMKAMVEASEAILAEAAMAEEQGLDELQVVYGNAVDAFYPIIS